MDILFPFTSFAPKDLNYTVKGLYYVKIGFIHLE